MHRFIFNKLIIKKTPLISLKELKAKFLVVFRLQISMTKYMIEMFYYTDL